MPRYRNIWPFLLTVLAVLAIFTSCGQKPENINHPGPESRILDRAGLLTSAEEQRIFEVIDSLETSIGTQIAILTIDTLNGRPIEDFSLERANRMGIGRKEFNDGILITVSRKDRKTRIEVGAGLEKIISNEIAAEVIRDQMVPEFSAHNYGKGVLSAVVVIKKLIVKNAERIGK